MARLAGVMTSFGACLHVSLKHRYSFPYTKALTNICSSDKYDACAGGEPPTPIPAFAAAASLLSTAALLSVTPGGRPPDRILGEGRDPPRPPQRSFFSFLAQLTALFRRIPSAAYPKVFSHDAVSNMLSNASSSDDE